MNYLVCITHVHSIWSSVDEELLTVRSQLNCRLARAVSHDFAVYLYERYIHF